MCDPIDPVVLAAKATGEAVEKVLESEPINNLIAPVTNELGLTIGEVANVFRFYVTENLKSVFKKWAQQRNGKPLAIVSLTNGLILPSLNRCERCGKAESTHQKANHEYKRDSSIPEWHGWHAARRGLGSNLYRLGVPDMVIQRILRHANVSTTATYYIKTAAADVRNAMTKLENSIAETEKPQADTNGTLEALLGSSPTIIQ